MKKLNILMILSFLLLLTSVFAQSQTTYTEAGNFDGDSNGGFGLFNTEITTDELFFSQTSNGVNYPPLYEDLNNDNITDLLIVNPTSVSIYNVNYDTKQITATGQFTYVGSAPYSNPVVFDIDGDNTSEIIVASALYNNEQIIIFGYNGTEYVIENNYSISTISHGTSGSATGEFNIKCGEVEKCIAFYTFIGESAGNDDVFASGFNSTGVGSELTIETSLSANNGFCFPSIPIITYNNYDSHLDSEEDFAFSYIETNKQGGGNENYKYAIVNIADDTLTPTLKDLVTVHSTNIVEDTGSPLNCQDDEIGKYFTSPLVADTDNNVFDGLEIVIGAMDTTERFGMWNYASDGTENDDHPEISWADGEIISNIVLANSFPDTNLNDYCVVGYNSNENHTDILCGSIATSTVPATHEYTMNSPFDVAGGYTIMTHSAQMSSEIENKNGIPSNPSEIITPFGVVALTDGLGLLNPISEGSCSTGGNCLAELIYSNPKVNASFTNADIQGVGRDDFIIITDNNLFYLDDGFSNQAPDFVAESTCINPNPDATWKINTSVSIQITATDDEGDDYKAKAILYDGEGNAQDTGFSGLIASGTTIPLSSLIANQTTASSNILLVVQDSNGNNDTFTVPFSVATDGIELGDSIGCISIPVEADPDEVVNATQIADVKEEVLNAFGLSSAWASIVGLMIILGVMYGTIAGLTSAGVREGSALIYLPMATGCVTWLVLVIYDFIGAWTVLLAILLASALIGYKVVGQTGNGGM